LTEGVNSSLNTSQKETMVQTKNNILIKEQSEEQQAETDKQVWENK
jgi:hypothetical protein